MNAAKKARNDAAASKAPPIKRRLPHEPSNADLQQAVEEKDKRIQELEKKLQVSGA